MPADEILDPHGYSLWLPAIGLLAVAIVIVGWIILRRLTRPPQPPTAEPPAPAQANSDGTNDPWAAQRAAALSEVDALDLQFQDGTLASRDVHQSLSVVLREFTAARVGLDATRLTLTELELHPNARPATEIITGLYAPEFSAHESWEPEAALARTRQVISQW